MLEVADKRGSVYLFHSVLSFSPSLQCSPQGGWCLFFFFPHSFMRNRIPLAPLPCTSAAPASNVPLELFNARPSFVILHVLFSCPRQKWLNCSWFLPSFYFVSFKKKFFRLRDYITTLWYAVIRISLANFCGELCVHYPKLKCFLGINLRLRNFMSRWGWLR